MKYEACVLAVAVAASLTGCETPEGTPYRAGTGALIGTGIGAASGALIAGGHHAPEGALIGGALGAITGGLIGNSMDQQERVRLQQTAPQTYLRIDQGQPLGLEDIKAMTHAGISDDIIISQIRNTHTAYRLATSDIIDLHNAGVNPSVIDYMINAANTAGAPPQQAVINQAPPPPPQETFAVQAPGPGYVWLGGDWVWNGRWVWAPGHWVVAPRPGAFWIKGGWVRGPHGWYHRPGYWRY